MKNAISIVFMFLAQVSLAQKEEYNWYFGKYAALSFETGVARPKYDNVSSAYRKTASISDRKTGRLLFYTDAVTVWNSKHQLMKNDGTIIDRFTGDVVIVPIPGSTVKYYIFYISMNGQLWVKLVDMSMNGGDGYVSFSLGLGGYEFAGPQITVVRHQYADAYWIITHGNNNNRFSAYYLDEKGFSAQPVISEVGLRVQMYGDMVGSNKGDKLAVTHLYGNDFKVEVFDFDRVCGVVSRPIELAKQAEWDHAYGIAFSPDDSKLYTSYGSRESQLVQYSGTDFTNMNLIARSPQKFNGMQLGPDGSIYMTTYDNDFPGEWIDAILNPNAPAGLCSFRETYLHLDDGMGRGRVAQFELPAFVTGQRQTTPIKDSVFSCTGACVGDTVKFFFNKANPYDSIHWKFGDNNNNESSLLNPVHIYRQGGRYEVLLSIFRCGKSFELKDTIRIDSFPVIDLPKDTVVCAKTIILLHGPVAEKYIWSTGAQTGSVLIKDTGSVQLTASNGNCNSTDFIRILNYPDLITLLGSEYFLCEDDKELVKLDAGEGFTNYKWTPTKDTTQWIVVGNTGEFFVKVTDNHGCIGNDGTRVKRRCGIQIYFPNVFTPNNDGVNDFYRPSGVDVLEFNIKIYNRWGELLFETGTLDRPWDGTVNGSPAPDGVYVYKATYSGYQNKQLLRLEKKGTITLVR